MSAETAGRARRGASGPRRRSHLGLVLAGAIVVAGGVAVAVVEMLRFPKGSIWAVIAVTAGLVALIRAVTAPR